MSIQYQYYEFECIVFTEESESQYYVELYVKLTTKSNTKSGIHAIAVNSTTQYTSRVFQTEMLHLMIRGADVVGSEV